MKQLIINKKDLEHNIKAIQKLANLDIPADNGDEYKIIGVIKGNRLWVRTNRVWQIFDC